MDNFLLGSKSSERLKSCSRWTTRGSQASTGQANSFYVIIAKSVGKAIALNPRESHEGMVDQVHKNVYMGPLSDVFSCYATSHPLILELS